MIDGGIFSDLILAVILCGGMWMCFEPKPRKRKAQSKKRYVSFDLLPNDCKQGKL